MRRALAALCGVAALAVAVVPSAPANSDATAAATAVGVTLGKPAEMKITFSKRSVSRGSVTFKVVNRGKIRHDFKIGGKKTASLKSGQRATLRVKLRKGRAAYLCTLPGHAAAGMKGRLTVK